MRKSTIIFVLILLVIQSYSFYYQLQGPSPEDHTFILAHFPVQLISVFNIMMLYITVSTFTEEYHTGQMRLILQRSFTKKEIYYAKVSVLAMFTLLFLIIHFLVSNTLNFILLLTIENSVTPFSIGEMIYQLNFYGIAFLSLISLLTVFITIAIISNSVTAALVIGTGAMLFFFAYPNILQVFMDDSPALGYIILTSLVTLQYHGIPIMMDNVSVLIWGLTVLLLYMFVNICISYYVFTKRDIYI